MKHSANTRDWVLIKRVIGFVNSPIYKEATIELSDGEATISKSDNEVVIKIKGTQSPPGVYIYPTTRGGESMTVTQLLEITNGLLNFVTAFSLLIIAAAMMDIVKEMKQ